MKKPRKDTIKLNKREKLYVKYRAAGKSKVDSVKLAGYRFTKDNDCSAYGCQLEEKHKITKAIEYETLNKFDIKKITASYVLDLLDKIATTGVKEANRLRAVELLGKYRELALFTDNLKITNSDEDTQFRINRLMNIGVRGLGATTSQRDDAPASSN